MADSIRRRPLALGPRAGAHKTRTKCSSSARAADVSLRITVSTLFFHLSHLLSEIPAKHSLRFVLPYRIEKPLIRRHEIQKGTSTAPALEKQRVNLKMVYPLFFLVPLREDQARAVPVEFMPFGSKILYHSCCTTSGFCYFSSPNSSASFLNCFIDPVIVSYDTQYASLT